MARKSFKVKPYAHQRLKFVVTSNLDGKRQRKFFCTKLEAQTYAEIKEVELLNQGVEAATLSTELRILAQRAASILQPFGKTVLDAAEFYASHLRSIAASRSVATVIDELIVTREQDGLSADYLADLKLKYKGFSKEFGGRMIASVTAKEISDWIRGLKVGPVSRNTVRSRLATLFSYAKRAGYLKDNPIGDVERAKERETEVGILTVNEAASLMVNADPETLPFWVIGAFAGLRSAEIERLEWHDLDLEDGLIEVKASKAKTASRRLVTMMPNLRAWLRPYRTHKGMVCPIGLRKKLEADRKRAGLLKEWPQNALRHSFGSYHLAEHKDAAALALQMGNSPRMIFKHYREVVKPKDAARYWNIMPSGGEETKVIAFAAS